jgi:tRNA threonylcarbamoyladenosine biosynthesis protein TsaB
MNILAFDTCFGAVSAAVSWRSAGGEWLLREAYEARTAGHAERLFPMVAEVMEGAGLAFSSIDRIAVTLGPGTFTGVRVGIAAARAFALTTDRSVAGTTSLAVMARRADLLIGHERAGRPLAVAVDARRGMVYFQVFPSHAIGVSDAQLTTPERAARLIGRQPVLVVGSGAATVVAAAEGHAEARLPDLQPHARSLAIMAPELAPAGRVMPIYLRQPDAKPQTDKALPRMPP